jgi:hypothetical protein
MKHRLLSLPTDFPHIILSPPPPPPPPLSPHCFLPSGDDEEDGEEGDQEAGQKRNRDRDFSGLSSATEGPQPIDQALLKKYLLYSRAFVKPVLQAVDSEKVRTYVQWYDYYFT